MFGDIDEQTKPRLHARGRVKNIEGGRPIPSMASGARLWPIERNIQLSIGRQVVHESDSVAKKLIDGHACLWKNLAPRKGHRGTIRDKREKLE
jgi:hypothetical protein